MITLSKFITEYLSYCEYRKTSEFQDSEIISDRLKSVSGILR